MAAQGLVVVTDLGISAPEGDGHVDDPQAGAAGGLHRGGQPRQVAVIAGETLHDALLDVHHEQGGRRHAGSLLILWGQVAAGSTVRVWQR
jgi:hypothetical protein